MWSHVVPVSLCGTRFLMVTKSENIVSFSCFKVLLGSIENTSNFATKCQNVKFFVYYIDKYIRYVNKSLIQPMIILEIKLN